MQPIDMHMHFDQLLLVFTPVLGLLSPPLCHGVPGVVNVIGVHILDVSIFCHNSLFFKHKSVGQPVGRDRG